MVATSVLFGHKRKDCSNYSYKPVCCSFVALSQVKTMLICVRTNKGGKRAENMKNDGWQKIAVQIFLFSSMWSNIVVCFPFKSIGQENPCLPTAFSYHFTGIILFMVSTLDEATWKYETKSCMNQMVRNLSCGFQKFFVVFGYPNFTHSELFIAFNCWHFITPI